MIVDRTQQYKKTACMHCNKEVSIPKYGSYKQACNDCIQKGLENPNETRKKLFKERLLKTIRERYDVDNIQQIKAISNKTSQTFRNKYGGVGFASMDLAEKTRETIKEKYGSENIMQTEYGKNLFRGENNPVQKGNAAALKISSTSKGKTSLLKGKNYEQIHGQEKTLELKNRKSVVLLGKFNQQLYKYLDYMNLELIDETYKGANYNHRWKCKICGENFEHIWNKIQQGYRCPTCFPRSQGFSKGEKELAEFIKNLGFEVIENDRSLIGPREIDIVIPSLKIAFEFNGLFYHSEEFKPSPNYHIEKTVDLSKLGYRLYQIFEDEWIYKNEIVKKQIENFLGVSNGEKIDARDCQIKIIDSKTKNSFLDNFHIQGKDFSVIKLGLFYGEILVFVMTFSLGGIAKGVKRIDKIWELSRFCSNHNYKVRGSTEKLLNYFINNYSWNKIYSYVDVRWPISEIYKNLGFKTDGKILLNYWYTTGSCDRIHRFKLRKRKSDPVDISERILRIKEGYKIIWDCGNLKFELTR